MKLTTKPNRILIALFALLLCATPSMANAQGLPGSTPDAPCADGRLRLRDIQDSQSVLAAGLESSLKTAQAWQKDARLYQLRLTCPIFTTGLKWEGEYFSPTAQSMLATDTGKIEPIDVSSAQVPTLDVSQFKMLTIYQSLSRAGFEDDALLSASAGMTIQPSTDQLPFGPRKAPRGVTYAHLAIDTNGQVTDVWVSLSDGVIYRY